MLIMNYGSKRYDGYSTSGTMSSRKGGFLNDVSLSYNGSNFPLRLKQTRYRDSKFINFAVSS